MNDDFIPENISEFIGCLVELLTRPTENVQMTARQLTDFPQWLQLAGDRCMAVRSHRFMIEASIREAVESVNQQRRQEEDDRNWSHDRELLEFARAQEEEAQFRAEMARLRLVELRDREGSANGSDSKSKEEDELLARQQAETLRKEEQERQNREDEERRKMLEEEQRKLEEQRKEQEKQRKIQEERARQNEKPVISNQPHVKFMSFLETGKPHLKFCKNDLPAKLSNKMNDDVIQYPIGVAYDEKAQLWFICDRNTHKMVIFNTKKEFIKICDEMSCPTAIMVYEEGRNVAVLCAYKNLHTIYTYDYSTSKHTIQPIISHQEDIYDMKYKLRGLAKSVASNIISMETNTLRVFKRRMGGKVFEMADTKNPCFLATFKTLVAVSDVVLNRVFIFSLDDRNWDAVTFTKLNVIGSDMDVPIFKLADMNGFKFVSGVQFDVVGNLMVADSKGHSIKVYDREFKFLQRVSSVFPLPYVSSFHISKEGECMLLDTKDPKVKLHRLRLTAGFAQLPWNRPEYWGARDFENKKQF